MAWYVSAVQCMLRHTLLPGGKVQGGPHRITPLRCSDLPAKNNLALSWAVALDEHPPKAVIVQVLPDPEIQLWKALVGARCIGQPLLHHVQQVAFLVPGTNRHCRLRA